jgi:arylsulfatase A-like enzyme
VRNFRRIHTGRSYRDRRRAAAAGFTACVALLATGLAAAACAPHDRAAIQRPIVVIAVDTLRADHLGTYGYSRDTSPRLDNLVQEGVVYEHAFATASWTLPSMTSLLTGRWPREHGAGYARPRAGARNFSKLRDDVSTLAESLREAGYATGAVANVGFMSPRFGFGRGFESYDWVPSTDEENRRAGASVDRALEWIDAHAEQPFFFLLHLFDPHRHYDAPTPFRGKFTDSFRDRYGATLDTLESRLQAERDSDLEFHIAAYDEEIAYTDDQIGRFVDALRERGIWDDALVVLTADHGESLHDHDTRGHGGTLYNELIRVPFIVWGAGSPGTRERAPISLVDFTPTALEWAGAPPAEDLPGISLLPALGGTVAYPERVIAAEIQVRRQSVQAVIRWPYKLIVGPEDTGTRMLFDLDHDFAELQDLMVAGEPGAQATANELLRVLRNVRQRLQGEEVELAPEEIKELRALGYIQ